MSVMGDNGGQSRRCHPSFFLERHSLLCPSKRLIDDAVVSARCSIERKTIHDGFFLRCLSICPQNKPLSMACLQSESGEGGFAYGFLVRSTESQEVLDGAVICIGWGSHMVEMRARKVLVTNVRRGGSYGGREWRRLNRRGNDGTREMGFFIQGEGFYGTRRWD